MVEMAVIHANDSQREAGKRWAATEDEVATGVGGKLLGLDWAVEQWSEGHVMAKSRGLCYVEPSSLPKWK